MQTTRSTACLVARRPARRAFTLVEMMVVVVIVGVLAALAIPSYQRALEQSKADVAAANLRAIWSAERVYWLEYQTYQSNLATLQSLGILDPAIVLSNMGFVYAVPSAGANAFQATATRSGTSSGYSGHYTVDETGLVTGALTMTNRPDITPGFQ